MYKALFETPDCQSLLLSKPVTCNHQFFYIVYSMKQTRYCCQLQAGGIIVVMYDSKDQQCLLP